MAQSAAQFTPMAVEAMNRAYNSARKVLRQEGAGQDANVRAGEAIIFLARNGITDERELHMEAVHKALGRLPRGLDGRL